MNRHLTSIKGKAEPGRLEYFSFSVLPPRIALPGEGGPNVNMLIGLGRQGCNLSGTINRRRPSTVIHHARALNG